MVNDFLEPDVEFDTKGIQSIVKETGFLRIKKEEIFIHIIFTERKKVTIILYR